MEDAADLADADLRDAAGLLAVAGLPVAAR
jgi:hypothetical protein